MKNDIIIKDPSFCKCGEYLGLAPKEPSCKSCLEIEKKKKDKEARTFMRKFKGRSL